jgi:hypothetical protein
VILAIFIIPPSFLFLTLHSLAVIMLISALFLHLILTAPEMFTVIMVAVTTIGIMLRIAVCPDPLDLVPPQSGRQVPVTHCIPWAMASMGPVPATIPTQVVAIMQIENIVRHSNRNIKAKSGRIDKVDIIIDEELLDRWSRDNNLLGLIAKVDIHIDADIACVS